MRLRKGTPPSADEAAQIMGSFSPADAARALDAREELRRVRRLVLRGAVADVLQPLVLPRLDLARIRHEQGTAAATTSGSTHPRRRRSSTASKRPASRWRIYFDELQLVSFTGVLHAPVLEQYWRTEHFATMSEFYEDVEARHAARLLVHRAAHDLQPQRLPPAVRQAARERRRRGRGHRLRRLRRARGRGARARDLRGDQAQRTPRRLQRDEHDAPHHVRRARRHLRSRRRRRRRRRRTTTPRARWASGSIGSDAACPRSPSRPTRARARSSTTRCTTRP